MELTQDEFAGKYIWFFSWQMALHIIWNARLEVGSESGLDRSKSIKTHLMPLFAEHGNCELEV